MFFNILAKINYYLKDISSIIIILQIDRFYKNISAYFIIYFSIYLKALNSYKYYDIIFLIENY